MTEQVFELDNYRGPMDLLLHLIREQELEITEVDLSRLCDQYLAALEVMRAIDIDVAGEFLVMASTLVLIKSRKILPREDEVNLEEELDPGDELIQQLLEYRKFKSLSMELESRATERGRRHPRGSSELPPDPEPELAEVGMWDLVGSFVRLMEETGLQRDIRSLREEKPLRAYLREVLERLASAGRWTLRDIVRASGDSSQVFGYFLCLLELVKTQQVRLTQERPSGDIAVELREDRDPSRLAFLDGDGDEAARELAGEDSPPEAPA